MQLLRPGQVPRRVRKRQPNVIEKSEEFKTLIRAIADKKLAPGERMGLAFDEEDEKKLGLRWPARVAADALKRWLAETLSSEDYKIRKFKVEGRQFVAVTRRKLRDKKQRPGAKGDIAKLA
jgi:hypothetical protein